MKKVYFAFNKLANLNLFFQIKANSVIRGSINRCITLAAYPKTKRFIMMEFDPSCITENGIECEQEITFTLDKAGFADFINYTTK